MPYVPNNTKKAQPDEGKVGKCFPRYYVVKTGKSGAIGYWQPTPQMRALGFQSTICGPDGPDAHKIANALNAKWREFKAENTSASLAPMPGTIAFALNNLRKSSTWGELANSTQADYERHIYILKQKFSNVPLSQLKSRLRLVVKGNDARQQKTRNALFSLIINHDRDPMIVYFVEAVGVNLIKIGRSRNVGGRLIAMRTDCPVDIRLLKCVAASHLSETEVQSKFNHLKERGEWFRDHQELREFIDSL